MKSSVWSKIKWLINVYRELRKNSYPLTSKGTKLMTCALISAPSTGLIIQFLIPEEYLISSINVTANEASVVALAICILTWLLGLALIIYELRNVTNTARKSARVLITGLPGTSENFPNLILTKAEQRLAREAIELSLIESENGQHSYQIERYNAELCVDLFKRFILHDDCNRLYIGGLARIPFLVSYGAFLRNVTAQITYFDKFHRGGDWKLLDDEDNNVVFSNFQLEAPNSAGDVGLAIGFSTPISIEQLPDKLKNHTAILQPEVLGDRNLIKNQENLQRISETVRCLIEKLSRTPSCKRIHLFLSVQSTLAIEIGRRFQEGTQCNWVIHNFDFESKTYNWALELSKGGIKQV